MKMSSTGWVAWVLVVIGAVNWGFIGVAGLNIVETIFGVASALTQFVYVLIGLGGLYMLWGSLSKRK